MTKTSAHESLRILHHRLSWREKATLSAFFSHSQAGASAFDYPGPHLAETVASMLEDQTLALLKKFQQDKHAGVLLIHNGPMDSFLPPTPPTGHLPPWQVPVSSLYILSLLELMKIEPVVYQAENKGRLFRHIVATTDSSRNKSSHGALALGHHVDCPDLPMDGEAVSDLSACPDFLSLFCMRTDPQTPTRLAFLPDLLNRLTEKDLEILQRPNFRFSRPASYDKPRQTKDMPFLGKDEAGDYVCRIDLDNAYPITEEGKEVEAKIRKILESEEIDREFLLLPGDFLIFRNQLMTHTRTKNIQTRWDGADRWLVRVFGLKEAHRALKLPVAKDAKAGDGNGFEVRA
ncbi:hypothetical protein FAI41_04830 [Acetobacteraceae bacterium]|nr:hypothetical protein FAI41_04830 [Acetobacteraceae bacterium]